jgi:hypothetical protein
MHQIYRCKLPQNAETLKDAISPICFSDSKLILADPKKASRCTSANLRKYKDPPMRPFGISRDDLDYEEKGSSL